MRKLRDGICTEGKNELFWRCNYATTQARSLVVPSRRDVGRRFVGETERINERGGKMTESGVDEDLPGCALRERRNRCRLLRNKRGARSRHGGASGLRVLSPGRALGIDRSGCRILYARPCPLALVVSDRGIRGGRGGGGAACIPRLHSIHA